MPESRIRLRERDAGLNGSAAPRAQKNDAAILLFLRQPVSEQQFLSLAHRDAEQQQSSIRVHMQGVRFFMERVISRAVSVHVHRNIERPARASAAVADLDSRHFGRLRGNFTFAD